MNFIALDFLKFESVELKFLKAMIVKKSDYFMRYNLLLNKRMYISAFHLWTDQIIQL